MPHELLVIYQKSGVLIPLMCLIGMTGCVSADLEQRVTGLQEQTKKMEKSLTNLETENANLTAQIRDGLKAETTQFKADREHLRKELNGRLEEVSRQVESLRRDLIDNVQKANGSVVKNVEDRLSTLDVLIGTILLRIEELERRAMPTKK